MPEPSDPAIGQIEQAIENGHFRAARKKLEEAEARLGQVPVIEELRRRLDEVESIAAGPQIEGLVAEAQEAINRADYTTAIRFLDEAAELAPHDREIRALREQTEAAAVRFLKQLKRNQAVREETQRIERAIETGKFETARQLLSDAGLKYGKHTALTELQGRLDKELEKSQQKRARDHVERAEKFFAEKAWRTVERELDEASRLDASNAEVPALRERLRAELAREEGQRQRERVVEEARLDVERLMTAGELERASRKLREVIEALGREEVFVELSRRISQAKVEAQTRHRLDWAERRSHEAEELAREAERLSLQGRYQEAVAKLETAHELDPDDTSIGVKLKTANTALERQEAKRIRADSLAEVEARIRGELESLHLDVATRLLREARAEFGDEPGLRTLEKRLLRLRQVESVASAEAGSPLALPTDEGDEKRALERQRALAEAYSWRQTLLYPFRGFGPAAFWTIFAALISIDVVAAIPYAGAAAIPLRLLVLLAVLSFHLGIVRATVAGRNLLPRPGDFGGLGRRAADLGLYLLLIVLGIFPCALALSLLGPAELVAPEASPAGWLVLVVLAWVAAVVLTLSGGVAGGLGPAQGLRIWRHPGGLTAAGTDALLVIDLVFLLPLAAFFVRVVLQPLIPWMGSPLAGAVEAYWLVGAPHWMGVLVRRHRLEMRKVYS